MQNIVTFMRGKKSNIVAGLLVLVAIVNLIAGDVSLAEVLTDPNLLVLLSGLGLFGVRDAIASLGK